MSGGRASARSRWMPYGAAILTLLWIYRTVLFGDHLPGDTGDARWTIAVYDHWYRVWEGLDGVRNLIYYYPLKNTLGTSDAFFVQGQIYSLARFFGLGSVNAWLVGTLVFALLGVIGVAALGRRLFASVVTQVAFTVLAVDSYPAVTAAGHVQLLGFYAGSWVVLGLLDIRAGRTLRGVATVAVTSALIALSSWYAVVLLGVLLGFLWLMRLILIRDDKGRTREIVSRVAATVMTARGGGAVAFGLAGWLAAAWIYLPGSSVLPRPTWSDTVIYSPRWSDIWNATASGGGLWGPLYDRVYPAMSSNSEQQLGFTPIVFLALCAASIVLIRLPRPLRTGHPPVGVVNGRAIAQRDAVLAAALTCAMVIGFFLVDERGLGFFRPIWSHVPGMTSIRTPFRVMIYVYPLAFFVILRTAELLVPRLRSPKRVIAVAVSVLVVGGMLGEMQRPLGAVWTRADLLPPALDRDVSVVSRQCDAVFVAFEDPTLPAYVTQIDAVILGVESGVPTPEGYSRGNPKSYPGDTKARSYVRWMRQRGFRGRVCVVSSTGIRTTRSTS